MTTYPHVCSCGNSYSDEDVDAYFCPSCVEQRKAVAKQIDAQFAGKTPATIVTDLQIALEKGKVIPSARGGQSIFIRASDLGISF